MELFAFEDGPPILVTMNEFEMLKITSTHLSDILYFHRVVSKYMLLSIQKFIV